MAITYPKLISLKKNWIACLYGNGLAHIRPLHIGLMEQLLIIERKVKSERYSDRKNYFFSPFLIVLYLSEYLF